MIKRPSFTKVDEQKLEARAKLILFILLDKFFCASGDGVWCFLIRQPLKDTRMSFWGRGCWFHPQVVPI